MDQKIKLNVLWLSCVAAFFGCTNDSKAEPISSNKDDIVMEAEVTRGDNGKIHVVCSIINKSPHVLASAYARTGSETYCFQFRLKDDSGKYIAIDDKWAWEHGQINEPPNADGSMGHKSERPIYIQPSGKVEFTFDLMDAYGEKVALGRELEIKWINYNPNKQIDVYEKKLENGTILPAYQETNHFPGQHVFSVSLPLPRSETEQEIQPPSTPEKAAAIELQNANTLATQSRRSMPEPISATSPEATSKPWWWMLLIIPLVFMIWRGVRMTG